jgi:hypothetical protein
LSDYKNHCTMRNLYFYFLCAALLPASLLQAQELDTLSAGSPETAFFPCHFSPYEFIPAYSEEYEVPEDFCADNGIEPHKPQWIGFTPSVPQFTVSITPLFCEQTDGGAQVGIWREPYFEGGPYVLVSECFYQILPDQTIILPVEGLDTWAVHYFVFDMFNDDVCQVRLEIEDAPVAASPIMTAPEIMPFEWTLGSNCPGVPLQVEATPVFGAARYRWTVDGEVKSTMRIAKLTFEEPGQYELCVTPTNDCYGDGPSTCDTVEVLPSPLIYPIDDVQACGTWALPPIAGENLTGNEAYSIGQPDSQNLLLPGTVIDSSLQLVAYDMIGTVCGSVRYFQVTISPEIEADSLEDQAECSFFVFPETDSSLNLPPPNYFSEPGGNGSVFAPGDTTVTAGTYYRLFERGACTEEQAFTVELLPDECTGGFVQIEGRTLKPNGTPISSSRMDLSWFSSATRLTSTDGQYNFSDLPAGPDYLLHPSRPLEVLDGIDLSDAFAILRHVYGLQTFFGNPEAPYLLIAADVNSDQTITVGDFLVVRNTFLGFLDTFPEAPSWRFVPTDFTFSEPNNPWLDDFPEEAVLPDLEMDTLVDFYGIKIGDVDFTNTAEGLTDGTVAQLCVPDFDFTTGQEVRIPIKVETARLLGLQGLLKYDPSLLQLDKAEFSKQLLPMPLGWKPKTGELPILLAAASAKGINAGSTVLTLEFTALRPGRVRKALRLDEQEKPVGIGLDGRRYGLLWSDCRSAAPGVENSQRPELSATLSAWCQPNPSRGNVQLHFFSPAPGPVRIRAFTAAGQQLHATKRYFEAGEHQFPLQDWLPQPGTYLISLSDGQETIQLWVVRM